MNARGRHAAGRHRGDRDLNVVQLLAVIVGTWSVGIPLMVVVWPW